jgi:CelD/BcsL family acetyltransferase involved in cellulose biosynthesis
VKNTDEVNIIRSFQGIELLAGEWDMLADYVGMPTLSYAWVGSCANALYCNDQFFVVTVRRNGILCGIAPLVMVERAGIKRLEFIGVSYLSEPSGVLYSTEDVLDVIAKVIVRSAYPIVLCRLPFDSPVSERLRSFSSGRCLMVASPSAETGAVPITSDWAEYVSRLSSRRRYDLRRGRQRAEKAGRVSFRMVSTGIEDWETALADFVRIEATGWKHQNGSSLRNREDLHRVFRGYASLASRKGTLRFAFLEVDGKPIAAQLSTEYSQRYWVLKVGYDEAWSFCSPGMQLLAETLRYAFDHKLLSYEFLGSDEPWLRGWGAERRRYCTAACYPLNPRGVYGFAADTLARTRAHIVSRLR